MVTVIWVIGTILAIDLLIVVSLVTMELLHRRRIRHEVSELDALWRAPASGPIRREWGAGVSRVEQRHPRRPVARSRVVARVIGNVAFGTAIVAMLVVVVVAAVGGAPSDRRPEVFARASLGSSPDTVGRGPRSSSGPLEVTSEQPVEADGVDHPSPPSRVAPPSTGHGFVPETFAAEPASWQSIVLVWAEVPEATGYAIERRTAWDGTDQWKVIGTTDPGETTFRDSGLESATTYFYRVSAFTEVGTSPPSDVISATTPGPPRATSLSAVATSSSTISLTWVDVEGETGYRIERSSPGVSEWTTIATAGADVTDYADGGLTADTKYRYRVYGANESGESGSSNTAPATTLKDPGTVTEPPEEDPQEPPGGSGKANDGSEDSYTDDTDADDEVLTNGTGPDGPVKKGNAHTGGTDHTEGTTLTDGPTGNDTGTDSGTRPDDTSPSDETAS